MLAISFYDDYAWTSNYNSSFATIDNSNNSLFYSAGSSPLYAQSLTPVPAPMDPGAPLLIRLLTSPAEPPNAATAIVGLLILTGLVLWAAARAVRRLEINYGTE